MGQPLYGVSSIKDAVRKIGRIKTKDAVSR